MTAEEHARQQSGLRLRSPRPDACQECAGYHKSEEPHIWKSEYYKYKFYEKHDRFPTWQDATAHCTEEMREKETAKLKARGIDVTK